LEKLSVPALEGSNAWVIAGSKTKSGKVFSLLNDTHIGFASPSVCMKAHWNIRSIAIMETFAGMHLDW